MTKDELIKKLGNLAIRFSEGWHEGIKIDASDIMLFNQVAEALAQPEQEPAIGDIRALKHRIHELEGEVIGYKQILDAQPEQEPVAWRAPNWGHSADEWVYRDFDDPVLIADGKPSPNNEPLYTTPPQRKPLTDEEIDKAWRGCDYTVPWEQHRIDIARAIEAAHGIGKKK